MVIKAALDSLPVMEVFMDNPNIKFCMGCMCEKEAGNICPKCGFDSTAPHHPLYLKAGTLISKRFIAGKLLSYNGEGATYLGYDLALNNKVVIREYMPDALATREQTGRDVVTQKGKETQYKTLLSDFCDLGKSLQKLRTYTGLIPILDFFEKNNTAYAIYEFAGGGTLTELIKNSGGHINYDKLKEKIIPMLSAVDAMHAIGIIHRGISPETITIDQDGAFRLGGFSIASARTAKSELAAELFSGYSPPELYSLTGWQGTWTDVYSAAAVIYTALTGITPPEAVTRAALDTLLPAAVVNPLVPEQVSDVLQTALALEPKERIQTIKELTDTLSQPVAAVTNNVEISDRGEEMYKEDQLSQKKIASKKKAKAFGRSFIYMLSSMVITTAVLLTIMFVILGEIDSSLLVFAKNTDSEVGSNIEEVQSEAVEDDNYTLPNFVGSYLESIKNKEEYMKKYAITETEEYNEDYPAGIIFEQNPSENTPARELINVAVKVSKGPAPIPDNIVGMEQADAEQALTDLKIKYRITPVYDDTIPIGQVVRVTRLPGEIMLMISQGRMDGTTPNEDDSLYGELTEKEYWEKWFS